MSTSHVRRWVPVVLSITIVATACGSDSDSAASTDGSVLPTTTNSDITTTIATTTGTEPVTSTTPTDPPTSDPNGTEPNGSVPVETGGSLSTMDRLAAVAIADAVTRFEVAAEAISVASVGAVTWRDAAAGCPAKGMQYTQVLTEGYRIVLDVDGTDRQYNTGGRRTEPFYCADPETPSSTE